MRFLSAFPKLLIACLAFAIIGGPAPAAVQHPEAAREAWGFDRSDLQPHPGVRFGVLPNGMRYAIMPNAVPAGGLSVRLRFDAGANIEGKREEGYLHLVEHLIFHGTDAIPEGSLPLMLAHRGLKHWSDVNAYTSFDETVYRIDMMHADAAARDAALLVMREVSMNLRFTRGPVAGAKRDVLEEIGGRNAAGDAMLAAQNAFLFPGTAIDRGPVAGTRPLVARAKPQALERLYRTYYVPDRATLVMVGDFDPAVAEAEIVARFSEWKSKAASTPGAPPPILRTRRGAEARLFVHPAAPTTVTLASVAPLDRADDGEARDAHFLQHIGAQIMNRRLARIGAREDAPFRSAEVAIYDHFGMGRLARIEVEAKDGDWRRALQAAGAAFRLVQAQGFSQAELDEQIAPSRHTLAASSPPRTSSVLADAIVDAVNRRLVFTAPADAPGADAYLTRVRLNDVNSAFKSTWGTSPLIFVSHNRPVPRGEQAILAAWREVAP